MFVMDHCNDTSRSVCTVTMIKYPGLELVAGELTIERAVCWNVNIYFSIYIQTLLQSKRFTFICDSMFELPCIRGVAGVDHCGSSLHACNLTFPIDHCYQTCQIAL